MDAVYHLAPQRAEPPMSLASLEAGRFREVEPSAENPHIMFTDVGSTMLDIAEFILGPRQSVKVEDAAGPLEWGVRCAHKDGSYELHAVSYREGQTVHETHYIVLMISADREIVDNLVHNLLFRMNRDPATFTDWDAFTASSGASREEVQNVWEQHFLRPILDAQNLINYAKDFGIDTSAADDYIREAIDEFGQRHYQSMMNWVDMAREVAKTRHAPSAQEEVKKILEMRRASGGDAHAIKLNRLRSSISDWKAEGFRVKPVEDMLERNDPAVFETFIRLNENIVKLRDIRKRLDRVPPGALDGEIRTIKAMLWDPELLPRIVERLEEVEGRISKATEDDIRNGFRMRLEGLRLEGFEVDHLEKMMPLEVAALEAEFKRFDELADEARAVLEELHTINAPGSEEDKEEIRRILRDPRRIDDAREILGSIRAGKAQPIQAPSKKKLHKGLLALIPGKK